MCSCRVSGLPTLLWDVNARTGFLDAFTDLRSGRVHSNPAALLAAILAGATNLGLERMAHASNGVSHAQLSWASAWYLRSETYADALARIIDAHHALPFSTVWGSASTTSSDGQFFASGRNAGEINAKYGPDPGLKIYSFLSGRYGSFHSNVIGATAGEAPFVLDGLVGNAAQFDPLVHHVDTGGVSDHVFALFHLLQPLVRASSARLSPPPAGVLRQTWAVERTRPPHGQTDQRGGRARTLERRLGG